MYTYTYMYVVYIKIHTYIYTYINYIFLCVHLSVSHEKGSSIKSSHQNTQPCF